MSTRLTLLSLALLAVAPSALVGQIQPSIPPGWVQIDDMILPDPFGPDSGLINPPWPGGIVPFVFNANVSAAHQTLALTAMAEVEAIANVDFVPRTSQANYVHIVETGPTGGNSSYLGMIGGAQDLLLGSAWTFKYAIVHELFHALGAIHEQSRPDRDAYVQINFGNVSQTACGGSCNLQFAILPAQTVGPYDLLSIMHYDQLAASANGQPTITVLSPNQSLQNQIGNLAHMTHGDAAGIVHRYGPPLPPAIGSLSPASVGTGSGNVTVTVDGQRFLQGSANGNGVQGSRVVVDGAEYATTYLSPTQLTAVLPAALFASAACRYLEVRNPFPGGGLSNSLTISVGGGPSVGFAATASFDSQGPACVYTPPVPLGAPGDPERLSWNGAGGLAYPAVAIAGPNNLGMPAAGSQYLRVIATGTLPLPGSFAVPRPLPAGVNEVRIPVPDHAEWVSFAWDFYRVEAFFGASDGMSIDVVDAGGNRLQALVHGDGGSPLSGAFETGLPPCGLIAARDTFSAGPQFLSQRLAGGCTGRFLSIACWSGTGSPIPSIAAIDDVRFGGRDADFEIQAATCAAVFPSPVNGLASVDPERVSWNGAGTPEGRIPVIDTTPNTMGMPSSGSRYLRLPAHGSGTSPIFIPSGGPLPRPLAGAALAANEVSIPIPIGARGISLDWDLYDTEGGDPGFNDGVSIDVVNAAGVRILNLAYADTTSPFAGGVNVETGGGCIADGLPRGGKLGNGFERLARALPALPAGARLSIVCWNGSDDLYPSHAVIDRLHFSEGAGFAMAFDPHNGPGSLQLAISGGAPASTWRFLFTVPAGAFPFGWFFGVDPQVSDIVSQLSIPAPPFIGTLDAEGGGAFEIPGGVPPGLTLHGVAFDFSSAGAFLGVSPPVTHTIR